MEEAIYSSNFVLFLDGLKVQHTVRSDGSAEDHHRRLKETISILRSNGFSEYEGGIEEGQATVDIVGYVVAPNKRGHVVWCYMEWGAYHAKGGVIYDRHFPKLPFDPLKEKMFTGESAPSREWAISSGMMHPCKMKILTRQTERKTDEGKFIWEFVDVVSGTAAPGTEQLGKPSAAKDDRSPEEFTKAACAHISQSVVSFDQLDVALAGVEKRQEKLSPAQLDMIVAIAKSKIAILLPPITDTEEKIAALASVRKHRTFLGEDSYKLVMDNVSAAINAGAK